MSLSYDWDEVFGWIGHDEGYDYSPAGALGYLSRCLNLLLVMDMMMHYLTEIKVVLGWSLVLPETMYTGTGCITWEEKRHSRHFPAAARCWADTIECASSSAASHGVE